MKTIKAILIDPATMTISMIEIEDQLDAYYKVLECEAIDAVRLPNGDAIYVDDEGLYKIGETGGFKIGDAELAGKGLVIGTDPNGYSIDAKSRISDIVGGFAPFAWMIPIPKQSE